MKTCLCLILLVVYNQCFSQTQVGQEIDGEADLDRFGETVALSSNGQILAVGAPVNDGLNGIDTGQVKVFENIAGVWTQIGQDIEGEAPDNRLGRSIDISNDGSIIAIGVERDFVTSNFAGHVKIYENIAGSWTQVGATIYGESGGDRSGISISLSGDGQIIAIGADANDGNGSNSGHVRIYENIAGTWTQIGQDIDGEAIGDQLGVSVSLSGNGQFLASGASRNDGLSGTDSGHARVYENIAGIWTQIGQDIDGEASGDSFGLSISMSDDGSIVAVGSPFNSSSIGHVRVYENIAGTWTQIGQDIDGEAAGDFSSTSIALSSDGSVIAIGAATNDGNGASSGHVRVYRNISGVWTQVLSDIDGVATNDRFGTSVAISADGTIVAIGGPQH